MHARILIVAALLGAPFTASKGQQSTLTSSYLTVKADCHLSIVDARHKMTVTVDDGPQGLDPVTVSADLPETVGPMTLPDCWLPSSMPQALVAWLALLTRDNSMTTM